MYCARLDHFVRLNADSSIGKCGHMIAPPTFRSWSEMQASEWLAKVKQQMLQDVWPTECKRCQITESQSNKSIRNHSSDRDKVLSKIRPDYLILGGVLDNVCNSACQSCNESLSTKIGSLKSKNYLIVDNSKLLAQLPQDQIVEVDISGGEPTASPRYQNLIANLPKHTKILRLNTNASRLLPNIHTVLDKGIMLLVTISLDGTGKIHDYVRWPIKWSDFCSTVTQYNDLAKQYDNLKLQAWTTLHALNLADFDNIKQFAREHNLDHDWAYLSHPQELNVRFKNAFTIPNQSMAPTIIAIDDDNQQCLDRFIADQDRLRGIKARDYL